jgi:CO/xanthine dehydrogenase FAD-binding subunit
LEPALDALAKIDAPYAVIAGGTDLVAEIKHGLRKPEVLVDISRIESLKKIRVLNGQCVLGPLVTHRMLSERSDLGILSKAAGCVGSPQIRSRGTVGGNLVNGSPAADTAAALIAMGAEIMLQTAGETRSMPLEEFFTGPGETLIEPGELLSAIVFNIPSESSYGDFIKLGQRNALAISIVTVAIHADQENTRICLGSVAPTPIRAREAEELFKQGAEAAAVGRAARAACRPIDDVRASAWYREEMVEKLTASAVENLQS